MALTLAELSGRMGGGGRSGLAEAPVLLLEINSSGAFAKPKRPGHPLSVVKVSAIGLEAYATLDRVWRVMIRVWRRFGLQFQTARFFDVQRIHAKQIN